MLRLLKKIIYLFITVFAVSVTTAIATITTTTAAAAPLLLLIIFIIIIIGGHWTSVVFSSF